MIPDSSPSVSHCIPPLISLRVKGQKVSVFRGSALCMMGQARAAVSAIRYAGARFPQAHENLMTSGRSGPCNRSRKLQ